MTGKRTGRFVAFAGMYTGGRFDNQVRTVYKRFANTVYAESDDSQGIKPLCLNQKFLQDLDDLRYRDGVRENSYQTSVNGRSPHDRAIPSARLTR
jgi:hypothetical protein